MNKGYLKGIFLKISPELEVKKLKERILRDMESIGRYALEIERYETAIKRAEKRIKIANKILKRKFADIEQL